MEHIQSRPDARMRFAAAALAILLIAMVAASGAQELALNRAQLQVSAVYQKAFYESCELMNGLQLSLRKLLVSGSGAQEQALLGEIAQQAQGIESNLALLPLGQETVSSAVRFVNQVSDYARTLTNRIATGGAITSDDWTQLSTLSDAMSEMTLRMNDLLARYLNGEEVFSAEDFAATGEEMGSSTQPAVDYPALLYDGPFSEGRETDVFAGLTGDAVTREEAGEYLRAFAQRAAGEVSNLQYTGESAIPVECWEFSLVAGGYALSASVTKQGGHVLYMLPENDVAQSVLSRSECIDKGLAFLAAEGFGRMHVSYYRTYDGILTVNYAAIQDDVVLYPDLVKLQISMRDGAVIGIEASNYYANHIAREIGQPALSVSDAVSRVSDNLSVNGVQLCVIPLDVGEALCYECSATRGTETYLIYIDANTGMEREIMQVVNAGDGIIAQ